MYGSTVLVRILLEHWETALFSKSSLKCGLTYERSCLEMIQTRRRVIDAQLRPHFGASPFWKGAILRHRLFRKCRFWGIALSEGGDFGASKSSKDSKRAVAGNSVRSANPLQCRRLSRVCTGRNPPKTKKNPEILPMKCPYGSELPS